MPNLTYAQLEGLWIKAGGPPAVAAVAAAIALAESGGNPGALNPNDNGGTQSSFGLWQISTGTHTPPAPNWSDPAVNASLAVGKYRGAGNAFTPWGTFDSGAYRAFLNGSTTPDMNVPGGGGISTTAASADPTCAVALPSAGLGPISVGGGCMASKAQVRAVLGGLMIGSGVIVLGFGLALLAIYGLGRSRTVQTVVALVGGGKTGGASKAAASAATRQVATRQASP